MSGLLFAWKLVYYHGHTRNHGLAIGAGFGFRVQSYNGFWVAMPYVAKKKSPQPPKGGGMGDAGGLAGEKMGTFGELMGNFRELLGNFGEHGAINLTIDLTIDPTIDPTIGDNFGLSVTLSVRCLSLFRFFQYVHAYLSSFYLNNAQKRVKTGKNG